MPSHAEKDISSQIQGILSLESVRSQAHRVLEAAKRGGLTNFNYHEDRMPEVAEYVANIIRRDFGPDKYNQIPPHGRWQQFNVGGKDRIGQLLEQWRSQGHDNKECARRMVDLLFVSVLLDAGAGHLWKFKEPVSGQIWGRSEGIALATLHMFLSGKLSSGNEPHTVDSQGLRRLDISSMQDSFQISAENNMAGFESRVNLLNQFGKSLKYLPEIFGPQGRPGGIVDFLLSQSSDTKTLDYSSMWMVLQQVLLPCWPQSRTHIAGQPVGDAWPLAVLERETILEERTGTSNIQPFHKLTQWIGYSLRVPFSRLLNISWTNADLNTALAEYRNGGILVDIPVLELKPDSLKRGQLISGQELPEFDATSDEIVEWRAMTVALTDELRPLVSSKLGFSLSLAQLLEAGTFKAGRELAAKYRPSSKSSPILISGDGTLF